MLSPNLSAIEKFEQLKLGRILVCVDTANLETSVKQMLVCPNEDLTNLIQQEVTHKDCSWAMDYKLFKNYFSKQELVGINFYVPAFNTDNHNKFLAFLRNALSFKLITKPLKEIINPVDRKILKKANFDVEISVDAIFNIQTFDTLILFSGDSDFAYLIQKLRNQGKQVISFSRYKNASREIRQISNHYFDIVNFRHCFMKIIKRKTLIAESPRLMALATTDQGK